jgi:hypothetical protein
MELDLNEYSGYYEQSNDNNNNEHDHDNNNNEHDPDQSIVPIHIQREIQSVAQPQVETRFQITTPDPTELRERYQRIDNYRNQADFITGFTNGSLSREHNIYLAAILKLMMEQSSVMVVKGGLGPLQLEVGQYIVDSTNAIVRQGMLFFAMAKYPPLMQWFEKGDPSQGIPPPNVTNLALLNRFVERIVIPATNELINGNLDFQVYVNSMRTEYFCKCGMPTPPGLHEYYSGGSDIAPISRAFPKLTLR